MPINFGVYFIRRPVRIHKQDLAGHVCEEFLVGRIKLLQVLERDGPLVPRLVPPLDVLEAPLGTLGEVDEKVRAPSVLIVQLVVDRILLGRHETLLLHHFPKDPPGAHERPLEEDQRRVIPRWLVGQEDAGVKQKGPTCWILVKFLEWPVLYGFSANCIAGLFQKTKLRRLPGPYVAIDDDTDH